MAKIGLQTPDKSPIKILSATDGVIGVRLQNISGANIYLERDPSKANAADGWTMPNQTEIDAYPWSGDLYGTCDIPNGVIQFLKTVELKGKLG